MEGTFGVSRALIGMVHLRALPGSPSYAGSFEQVLETATEEARLYQQAGFHALLLENMHDRPYRRRLCGPETVAAVAVAAREVRRATGMPLGIQILAGANQEALAVALAAGASFIRAEGFVFAHVADEGLIEGDAGELLRYRRALGADSIRIFVDIKKKHSSHALTADVDLAETARAAKFFLADGLIVTGLSTGQPADPAHLDQILEAADLPVLVGSGVTPENLPRFHRAHGLIVGSSVKRHGRWDESIDPDRLQAVSRAFHA